MLTLVEGRGGVAAIAPGLVRYPVPVHGPACQPSTVSLSLSLFVAVKGRR